MDDERIAKMVNESEVEGKPGKIRTTRVWIDEVQEGVTNRGLTFGLVRVNAHDRTE